MTPSLERTVLKTLKSKNKKPVALIVYAIPLRSIHPPFPSASSDFPPVPGILFPPRHPTGRRRSGKAHRIIGLLWKKVWESGSGPMISIVKL
jgi:hypothetical protein